MYLVDTDVLIDAAKAYPGALQYLDELAEWSMSVCTAMELVVGARNRAEINLLEDLFTKVAMLSLTPAIASRAYDLLKTHAHAHGLRILDALIAATALEHGKTLVTRNQKHFRNIAELHLASPRY